MGALVELVGPSGSGKTTLVDSVLLDIEGEWALPLAPTLWELDSTNIADTNKFELLAEKALRLQKENLNSIQQTILLNYFTRILLLDEEIPLLRKDLWLVQDEGLVQNFSVELLESRRHELVSSCNQRNLVYLRPERPRTIVDRVLSRESEVGQRAPHHQGKSLVDLEQYAQREIVAMDRFVDEYERLTGNVLRLTAENDLTLNVYLLRQFLSSIRALDAN